MVYGLKVAVDLKQQLKRLAFHRRAHTHNEPDTLSKTNSHITQKRTATTVCHLRQLCEGGSCEGWIDGYSRRVHICLISIRHKVQM